MSNFPPLPPFTLEVRISPEDWEAANWADLPSPTPSEIEEARQAPSILTDEQFWAGKPTSSDFYVEDVYTTVLGTEFRILDARKYYRRYCYIRNGMTYVLRKITENNLETSRNKPVVIDGVKVSGSQKECLMRLFQDDPDQLVHIEALDSIAISHIRIQGTMKSIREKDSLYLRCPSEGPWQDVYALEEKYRLDRNYFAHGYGDPSKIDSGHGPYSHISKWYREDIPKLEIIIKALANALTDETVWAKKVEEPEDEKVEEPEDEKEPEESEDEEEPEEPEDEKEPEEPEEAEEAEYADPDTDLEAQIGDGTEDSAVEVVERKEHISFFFSCFKFVYSRSKLCRKGCDSIFFSIDAAFNEYKQNTPAE